MRRAEGAEVAVVDGAGEPAGAALHVAGHTHDGFVRYVRADEDTRPAWPGVTFVNAGTLARDARPVVLDLDLAAGLARYWEVDDAGGLGQPLAIALPRPHEEDPRVVGALR